jgi:putative N6-adenine-specific DNA methylase
MQVRTARYRVDRELYKYASKVPWESHFTANQTLRVDIRAIRSHLRSLQVATLRVKDAIVDRLREHTGERPSIDTQTPDVRVLVFLEDQQVSMYIDLSGENLFKRGWRQEQDKGVAPIKENLAAGLVSISGWDRICPLFDPFCGSGTVAIEAAQIAHQQSVHQRKQFGFEKLVSFDAQAWQAAKSQLSAAPAVDAVPPIFASDIDRDVLALAKANATRSGLPRGAIQLKTQDFLQAKPPTNTPGWIVSNIPYGERIALTARGDGWREMGAHLRANYSGWTVCLLSNDMKLPGKLGLREKRKIPLYNGTIDCRLFVFEMR